MRYSINQAINIECFTLAKTLSSLRVTIVVALDGPERKANDKGSTWS